MTQPPSAGVAGSSTTNTDTALRCPNCGAEVTAEAAFCEACGTALNPTAAPVDDQPDELESPIELSQSVHARIDPDVEDTIPIAKP